MVSVLGQLVGPELRSELVGPTGMVLRIEDDFPNRIAVHDFDQDIGTAHTFDDA
jgi:hypothetical protein